MGLLDDAIREHLDLKRRRGADPTEIERAEREALGPVRRMPEPGEAAVWTRRWPRRSSTTNLPQSRGSTRIEYEHPLPEGPRLDRTPRGTRGRRPSIRAPPGPAV